MANDLPESTPSDVNDRPSALGQLVVHNDIVFIADPYHIDGNISKAANAQLKDAHSRGANHLFLEHDPAEYTKEQAMKNDTEYGRLVRDAQNLGIQIHLYDDRSKDREIDARFRDEAKLRHETDQYLQDVDGLMRRAENPDRMKEYLAALSTTLDERTQFRNERMTENIANTMAQYPGERALVMMGSAHLEGANDVDEGLRARGFRTATAEINSPNTATLGTNLNAPDKPDFILNENGEILSYKTSSTNTMQRPQEGQELPWQNQEPVASSRAQMPSGMESALAAARNVDCSWARATPPLSQSARPQELGQMATPATQSYNDIAELQNAR